MSKNCGKFITETCLTSPNSQRYVRSEILSVFGVTSPLPIYKFVHKILRVFNGQEPSLEGGCREKCKAVMEAGPDRVEGTLHREQWRSRDRITNETVQHGKRRPHRKGGQGSGQPALSDRMFISTDIPGLKKKGVRRGLTFHHTQWGARLWSKNSEPVLRHHHASLC